MDPREEAASLNADPLPEGEIVDPLTQIYYLDEKIAILRDQIAELSTRRTTLFEYAIANKIEQDDLCRLVAKVTPASLKVDVDRLKTERPDVLEVIRNTQRINLVAQVREQFNTLTSSPISQDELKRAVPKAVFESFLYRPGEPRTTYTVVKRDV